VKSDAMHHTILLVDIKEFRGAKRTGDIRANLREQLYRLVREALKRAEVTQWEEADRGDAVLILVAADVAKTRLLDAWVLWLASGLRRYNDRSSPGAEMRLRAAVHWGEVTRDENGFVGTDLDDTFRLLDCVPIRKALDSSSAGLAVIVSDPFYQSVVKADAGLIGPNEFEQVEVRIKELRTTAWITVRGTVRATSARRSETRVPSQSASPSGIVFHGETRVGRDVVQGDVTNYGGERDERWDRE